VGLGNSSSKAITIPALHTPARIEAIVIDDDPDSRPGLFR
jgi:hypothetical protein